MRLVLLVLACVSAYGQTVTVAGNVVDAAGGAAVGSVTVSWPNFTYSNIVVPAGSTTKRPSAGAVSFTLYPGTYTVTYRLTGGQATTVKWIVPASPSSTTIAAVQTAFIAPNVTAPLTLNQGGTNNTLSGYTAGKCLQVSSDGTKFETASDGCDTSAIPANVQTGTSYTVVAGDKGKAIFLTNSSAVSVTIPAASAITGSVILVSKGAGGASLSGGYTVALINGDYVWLVSDGTTWRNVNQLLRAGNGMSATISGSTVTLNIDALLYAIDVLAGNGFIVQTGATTVANRSIAGTSNEVCVTNGDGVSGNPTAAICATFDVSGKTSTKPMKSGTSTPGTCAVGEMFFDTDATAGENLYGCTATDTWTQQAGGGGGGGSTAETYCVPSIVSGNLQISTPCNVLSGNVTLTFGSNITFDASSGTGTVFCGLNNAGTVSCWHNVTASCTNATCVGSTGAAPADACVLASATVTSGTVSSPVNVLLGRSCFRATTSSTVTVSNDPTSGLFTFDTVATPDVYFGVDAGSNDTYAVTATPAPGAYVTGKVYCFDANTANTGAATINFNTLGAKTLKKMSGAITTDLDDNDIRVGQHVCSIYDGTNMQMISQLGNAAAGGGSSIDVVKTTTPSSAVTCSDGSTWVDVQSLTLTGAVAGDVVEMDAQLERATGTATYELRMLLDNQDIMAAATFGACSYNDQYAGVKGSIGIGSGTLFNNTGCLRPSAYNMRFWKVSHTIASNPVLKIQVRNCSSNTIQVNYMEATIR